MTTVTPRRSQLATAKANLRTAQTELQAAIEAACPGPHKFVQHRDACPPWCRSCFLTATGNKPRRGAR